MRIGQHLFTKDGRQIGNAIITDKKPIDDHDILKGSLWQIETDFGNGVSWLTNNEIYGWWHLAREDGHVVVTTVEEWRHDRELAMKCSAGTY